MSSQQTGVLHSNTTNPKDRVNVRSSPSVVSESNIVARINSGTRVTVLPDAPVKDASGFTWYKVIHDQAANKVGLVRNDVIKLEPAPQTSQPSSSATFQLTVGKKDTVFKQSTDDSKELPDDKKVNIKAGTKYEISAFKDAGNDHFKVTLKPPTQIGKYNTWFVYKPAVSIK